jgi:hypothetical protein
LLPLDCHADSFPQARAECYSCEFQTAPLPPIGGRVCSCAGGNFGNREVFQSKLLQDHRALKFFPHFVAFSVCWLFHGNLKGTRRNDITLIGSLEKSVMIIFFSGINPGCLKDAIYALWSRVLRASCFRIASIIG